MRTEDFGLIAIQNLRYPINQYGLFKGFCKEGSVLVKSPFIPHQDARGIIDDTTKISPAQCFTMTHTFSFFEIHHPQFIEERFFKFFSLLPIFDLFKQIIIDNQFPQCL